MEMQFWGVDVKAKEPSKVIVEEGCAIHISQATLGDIKKDNETVIVHVKVGDKKFVLGMLSQKSPQLSFDLVFEKDFEISHNWKNGSIHLMGYKNEMGVDDSELEFGSSDDEEDVPLAKENGQLFASAANVPAVKPKEDNKPKTEKDDSDDSDSEDDSEDDSDDSDEEMVFGGSDSEDDEDDEDDSEDSEEETPAKLVEPGKKRPNGDAKTPQSKKAKTPTPQKTDGKKGVVHPGTPYPNKKGGKTPGGDKTPKSGGSGSGSDGSRGPFKKNFKSGSAKQSHSKAKHAK